MKTANEKTTLDYIKIVEVAAIYTDDADKLDVTFRIIHSQNDQFISPHNGIITLRLSEFIDTLGFGNQDIQIIATQLIQQTVTRRKDKEGNISFYHIVGQPLGDWIYENTPFLNQ